MMLKELTLLLEYVPGNSPAKQEYIDAIQNDNCLSKPTGVTRKLTASFLVNLYGLDTSLPLFRALLYFWHRDTAGQPLFALLSSYVRDGVLRDSAPYVLEMGLGETAIKEPLERHMEKLNPDRLTGWIH